MRIIRLRVNVYLLNICYSSTRSKVADATVLLYILYFCQFLAVCDIFCVSVMCVWDGVLLFTVFCGFLA